MLKKQRGLKRYHSDTVFFIFIVVAVAFVVSFAMLLSGGDDVSSDCDEYGNLVYKSDETLFVVEGAAACATTN